MSKYVGNTKGTSDRSWKKEETKGDQETHKKQTEITSSNMLTSEGLYLKPRPFDRTRIFLTIVEADSLTAELRNFLAWFRKVYKPVAAVLE